VVGAVIGGALVTALALLAVSRIIKRRGGDPTLQTPASKTSSSGSSGWVAANSNRYISSGGISSASGLFDGKAHISSQGLASAATGSTTNMLSSYADSPRHAAAMHIVPSPSAASLGGIEMEMQDKTNAGDNASPAATITNPCSNSDPQKLNAQTPASSHQHPRPASYVLPASAAGLLHLQAPTQGVQQVYQALQEWDSIRGDHDASPLEESLVVSSASHTGTHGQTSAQGSSHSSPRMNRVQQLAAIEQELRSIRLSLHGSQRNASSQAVDHSHTATSGSATGTDRATGIPSQQTQQSSNSKGGSLQHNTGSDSAPVTCALGSATPLSSSTADGSSSATTAAPSPDSALVDHIPGLTLTSTLGSVRVMMHDSCTSGVHACSKLMGALLDGCQLQSGAGCTTLGQLGVLHALDGCHLQLLTLLLPLMLLRSGSCGTVYKGGGPCADPPCCICASTCACCCRC
jgi:hypothetical protein